MIAIVNFRISRMARFATRQRATGAAGGEGRNGPCIHAHNVVSKSGRPAARRRGITRRRSQGLRRPIAAPSRRICHGRPGG